MYRADNLNVPGCLCIFVNKNTMKNIPKKSKSGFKIELKDYLSVIMVILSTQ